ncbi:MAG: hypothetical protein WKF51_11580 [Geodermatophilaceae bacterium]
MTSGNRPLVVPVTGRAWISFRPGQTGWAIYRASSTSLAGTPGAMLFLRFGRDRDDDGRRSAVIEVREVLVSADGGPIGPRIMRDLPLARAEAAVNQPTYREAVLARLPASNAGMVPFPWDPDEGARWWFAAGDEKPPTLRRPRLKLKVPTGRGRPDDFYRQVADRFAYLTTVSKRPATDLADANGVNVTTVHGWVKEARRRGLLPPGERSRRRGRAENE